MVAQTTDKFLDLLRRSGLVEKDALDQAVAKIEREVGRSIDGTTLADKLVEARLITAWHREKLIDGKYKGFFLVDKYKLLGHIGTGGMSTVYLAEHSKMQRLVAIKMLPKRRVNDSSYLARFEREAQAAAKLDHKNIVRAYDIDHQEDNHFLVMEYVEGRDLQTYSKDVGPLDYDTAADFIRQAADGLEHAHNAGLIHRDIKPSNLLVDQRGLVKVLDMGLARWEEDEKAASLTRVHEENVLGTADYLAPEQAKDSHNVDKRADIYSLGCTMYFLLTGHAPFPEGTVYQRILKHQTEPPKSIYEDRRDAPQALVDVCLRMMSKNREARYQTASEVAITLTKWLQSRGKDVTGDSALRSDKRPVGPPPRRPLQPPRRKDKASDADDTVSNLNQDTIKGKANSTSLQRPAPRPGADSQVRPGGSSVRVSGSSIVRHGSSIVRGGSSVLGGKSSKSTSKSMPLAKSLPKKDDEPLSSLIEEAAEQVMHDIEAASRGGNRSTAPRQTQPGQPATYAPGYHKSSDGLLPMWGWVGLGALLVIAVIVMIVIAAGGSG